MEFFRFNRDIPFMSWRRTGAAISIITFILSVFFIATKGLNLGVDFTGGTATTPERCERDRPRFPRRMTGGKCQRRGAKPKSNLPRSDGRFFHEQV